MGTDIVRINVTLPRDLVESLNHIAGGRSRSRLISESLRAYISQKEKAALEERLEEGYRAAAREGATLRKEFEAVDLEGWDEY